MSRQLCRFIALSDWRSGRLTDGFRFGSILSRNCDRESRQYSAADGSKTVTTRSSPFASQASGANRGRRVHDARSTAFSASGSCAVVHVERRIPEDRVVAEAMRAGAAQGDLAFDGGLGLEEDRVAARDGERRHESRRSRSLPSSRRKISAKRSGYEAWAPRNRADRTPGSPSIASITRPESSATEISPDPCA